MAFDLDDELKVAFSPEEFGEEAIIRTVSREYPLTGTPAAYADIAKPGSAQNSSRGAFSTGAADFSVGILQFTCLTTDATESAVAAEDTLIIKTGRHAGEYRIKDINIDGSVCRLVLNVRNPR